MENNLYNDVTGKHKWGQNLKKKMLHMPGKIKAQNVQLSCTTKYLPSQLITELRDKT